VRVQDTSGFASTASHLTLMSDTLVFLRALLLLTYVLTGHSWGSDLFAFARSPWAVLPAPQMTFPST
jgi:hypothetical protein